MRFLIKFFAFLSKEFTVGLLESTSNPLLSFLNRFVIALVIKSTLKFFILLTVLFVQFKVYNSFLLVVFPSKVTVVTVAVITPNAVVFRFLPFNGPPYTPYRSQSILSLGGLISLSTRSK